jgi:hypothetical protein
VLADLLVLNEEIIERSIVATNLGPAETPTHAEPHEPGATVELIRGGRAE